MKFLIICYLLLYSQLSTGQSIALTSIQIDSIVKAIDQTCRQVGISDGVIRDPDTKETLGGFSDWYCTDTSETHLVRVTHEESLYSYDFTYYYFHNDKLVFILFKRGKELADKIETTSIGKYYIQNNKLINKTDEIDFNFDISIYLKNAKEYFKDSKFWSRNFH